MLKNSLRMNTASWQQLLSHFWRTLPRYMYPDWQLGGLVCNCYGSNQHHPVQAMQQRNGASLLAHITMTPLVRPS